MNISRTFFLSFIVLFVFFSMPVLASGQPEATPRQEAVVETDQNDGKLDIGALGPSGSKPKPKKAIEHTYLQVTYDNLYKLAWSYDAFALTNDDAVNTYLMITECTLYTKFFQNEFEWEKIKIAAREFLKKNKSNVTRYYEYVQPIEMGRYDYNLQGFPIIAAQDFRAQKNLQFASFSVGTTTCQNFNIDGIQYPGTGVLMLNSPLNMSFIRVPTPLAQKYVEWRNRNGLYNDDKRQAYIRYRIRIDGYEGIKMFAMGLNSFAFRGKLMRIDVFADQEMLLPLYNQVF